MKKFKILLILICILSSIPAFAWLRDDNKSWGYNSVVNNYYYGGISSNTPTYNYYESAFQDMKSTSTDIYRPGAITTAASYITPGLTIAEYEDDLSKNNNVLIRMGIQPPHKAPIGDGPAVIIFMVFLAILYGIIKNRQKYFFI